jgi:ornithine cyclodeaminase/alanine dehydrogenase-like protein (mu-crystallin family)
MSVRFRLLTEADVKAVLTMDDLIETMASALQRFSTGRVVQPVRTVIPVSGDHAFFGTMPAFVGASEPRERADFGAPSSQRSKLSDADSATASPRTASGSGEALGAKLVTVFGGNAARGLHTHLATIVLLDPQTGALVALLDGRYITESRTAAVSAVSSRLLARKTSASLAIIGSGVQAHSHLEALARVQVLRHVSVWSPDAERRRSFVEAERRGSSVKIQATDHAGETVVGADIIVLATSSPTPVIENGWVKPGAHVISVGACRPTQREIDPALTTRARLFVDSREAALVESGDVVLGIKEGRFSAEHIVAELGEVVNGAEGRRSDTEVTIFKSLGMAVEDVTAADLAYRRAVERDKGTVLTL